MDLRKDSDAFALMLTPHLLLAESVKWYSLGLERPGIDLASISPMILSGGAGSAQGKKEKL